MQRIDKGHRVIIPKEFRDKYNFEYGKAVEVVDTDKGILIKPSESVYNINYYQIELLRKVYNTIKDSMILEDTDLVEFKTICRISDIKCPNCNEDMIITDDNSYKCINCGE